MSDLISRQAAIDALHMHLMYRMGTDSNKKQLDDWINGLPSVQPENQVHLCDSCRHVFPECPSEEDDVIYGNGKGNDNICACNKYEPSAQPEVLACGEGELSAQPEQTDCEYCHEDSDGYVIPLEKNSHAFIRFGMDGWELSLKAKGWHGSAKIRYCPMCGRRLERG